MGMRRALGFAICAALCLGMAACGEDDVPPPPASFAPLHYDYLPRLRLNVGTIDIQDHSAPLGPDDVSAQSPVTPSQALNQIAHDRLFAAGLMGSAQFVIDQASIVRGAGGALYGQMAVHLDILTAAGARAGYAEARVSRQHLPGSEPENPQTLLYTITRQMAEAMNVELEYQMRRSMTDILVTTSGVPAAVTAAPLAPADAPPQAAPPLVPPPQAAPDDQGPPAQIMSPPPGYLQQPQ
jgi:hypothetical protein